jgi:hypothetical protein
MYFPGEPLNEQDSIFRSLGASRRAAIGTVMAPVDDMDPDSMLIHWDIVLEKG